MLYTKLLRKKKTIKELTDLGIVSTTVLRDMQIFEHYSAFPESLCVYCKYELTAEEFRISSELVKKIISKMKR